MFNNRKILRGRVGRALMGCAAALALSIATGPSAQAQESLRFTTSVPAPSFIYADILSVWAQRVIDDSNGTLNIQMFPAGTLGRDPATHLDMARDGIADISYIILGYTPGAVNEATILELPGSTPSATVGSLAATMMVEEGLWPGQGMENVKILGAFSTAPTLLTTLEKVETLDDVAAVALHPVEIAFAPDKLLRPQDPREALHVHGGDDVIEGFHDAQLLFEALRREPVVGAGPGQPMGDHTEFGQNGAVVAQHRRNLRFRVYRDICVLELIPVLDVDGHAFIGDTDLF